MKPFALSRSKGEGAKDQRNPMIDEIAVNLYRIEVPLPKNPLRSINSYVIKDPDRNLIIDTGMNREECLNVLEAGLKSLGVDHVDIFLLPHVAKRESVFFEPLLKAMESIKKQGKARRR